jgi:hypothetical protein
MSDHYGTHALLSALDEAIQRKKNARRDTMVYCAALPMPLQSELNAPAAALCSVSLLSTHLSL